MTRVERIKEHLPRHGTRFGTTQGGNPFAERGGKSFFGDDCAEQSLSDFLADKSLTGARIKDLSSSKLTFGQFEAVGEIIHADDPDAHTAEVWKQTFIDKEEA